MICFSRQGTIQNGTLLKYNNGDLKYKFLNKAINSFTQIYVKKISKMW